MLKKSLVTAAIVVALFAANPTYADESASTWDGQYGGFSAGASYGMANPTVHTKNSGYFITTDPGQIDPQASHNLKETNVSGSLFWGFNRQTGNTVYGLEADLSLDNFNKQYNSGNINYLTVPASTFSVTTNVKSDWAVSLRPRLGYAFEKSLFYLSAGVAVRRFKYDFTFSDTFVPEYAHLSSTKWKLGWIAGLGYEHKMWDNWNLRAEYLYSSYKNIVNTQTNLRFTPADGFTHKLDFQAHTFRVGLSRPF